MVLAALGCGLALRLWFILHYAQVSGDTIIYGEIAKNWMHHGIYGYNLFGGPPHPTLIRLPGYPLFLAACFRLFGDDNYTAVMVLQTGIDLGSCWLASLLAGRLFGTRAGIAVLWIAALCPFTAAYAAAPLTETLTLFCLALTFYALCRWQQAEPQWNRWLWVLVFALAYSILLRPEQGLLSAAVVPAMLWIAHQQRRSLRPVIVAAVCVLLPLVPWTIRNARTFHVFQPLAPRLAVNPGELSPAGFNRWFRTWGIDFASTEDVYWNYDGARIEIDDIPTRAFDTDDQYTRTADLLARYNRTTNPTPSIEARFAALAQERIDDDPVRYWLTLPLARFVNILLRPRIEMFPIPLAWWRYKEHPGQTIFALGYGALNLAYLISGVTGFLRWRRQGFGGHAGLAWAMAASLLLRSALLLTLDNSEPRYTLEFFPVLFVWIAALMPGRERLSI